MPLPDDLPDIILNHLPDGVYFVDRQRTILYWNAMAERLTGFPAREVIGRPCHSNILCHVDGDGMSLCCGACPLAHSMEDGKPRTSIVYFRHHEGHRVPTRVRVTPLRDGEGRIVGAVETFDNHSEHIETRQQIQELERLALLDRLTEIANRRYLEQSLDNRLREMMRQGISFGILFLDVDHFKQINDQHGHLVGDEVLKMIARTLRSNIRAHDMIGRWGGDEFLALISHVDDDQLRRTAHRFRRLIASSSLPLGADRVRISVSIGRAMAQRDDTPVSLLRRADKALYARKAANRKNISPKAVVTDYTDAPIPCA